MIGLRERGIYAFPDGDEFVIHTAFRGGYLLYRREASDFFGAYAYESNSAGQLRSSERASHWRIEDLTDTTLRLEFVPGVVPPASVPKAPPAWVVSVLSHSSQRHIDTEKNQTLKNNIIRLG